MAKVIEQHVPRQRSWTQSQYPWDEWLDGRSWLLTQGEDFECTIDSMGIAIRKAAKARGLGSEVLTHKAKGVDVEIAENQLLVTAISYEDEDDEE